MNVFLSHSYFKSKNCLREVQATVDKKKPFMCTHEADQSKGGGPLEEIQSEVEDEQLNHAIFTEERLITVWYRISDFQLISLKQIVEFTLLQTPAYKKHSALPIYVPGELLCEHLGFHTPVRLYASPLNPGARELAAELEKAYVDIKVTTELSTNLSGGGAEAPPLKRLPSCCISPDRRTKAPTSTSDGATATHFLLYLNFHTYLGDVGKQLAEELRSALAAQLPIVMAHENGEASVEFQPTRHTANT